MKKLGGGGGNRTRTKAQASLATRAEAAQQLGISRRDLDRAVERGCPPPVDGPRGSKRYDVVAIGAWLAARPANGNGSHPAPVTNARARLLRRQGDLAAFKLAVQRGAFIDARAEQRRDYEIARTVRDSILGVPGRVSAELAAETDQGRVHERLEAELRAALNALADVIWTMEAHDDGDSAPTQGEEEGQQAEGPARPARARRGRDAKASAGRVGGRAAARGARS